MTPRPQRAVRRTQGAASRAPRRAGEHGPLERAARVILRDASRSLARVERSCARALAAAAEMAIASLEAGRTIYFCGNGGSAADAQHLACELAGRYLIDRPAVAAVALSTNTSSLTSIGNDYGFEHVFSRQLEGLGRPGDVLVAITTSGSSPNVLAAVRVAQRLGMTVIGMTGGKGADFAAECDVALVTPHLVTPRVQEGHIAMGHAFCELIERAMFGRQAGGAARAARAGGSGDSGAGARAGRRNASRPRRRRS
jgi:D-sedoheptulose 7-phosphate isomerase